MFGTRSFLKNSLATIIIIIMMLSVSTSAVSWTTSHQNIEAQNQRNSTYNSSSLRTTNTASSDKPSNTFKKLINSVCSVVSTNKAQVVDGNGFLTYVDPYHGIVMQYPFNWDYEESQAFAVCLLPLKSEGNANGH
jgi:hypothetical protein